MKPENQSNAHPNADTRLRLSIVDDPQHIDGAAWNALLAQQATPTPFMRHEYLTALHASASAVPQTGWTAQFVLLHQGGALVAACPLYLKAHSYGEYVFDWSWARAHAEHGIDYYPKALVAVPFTPVPGSRLLARDAATRRLLVQQLIALCADNGLSSLHLLYGDTEDLSACTEHAMLLRQQVQFHWKNQRPPRSPASPGALPPEGALAALGRPGGGSDRPPRSPAAPGALPPERALAALRRPGGGSDAPSRPPTALDERFADFDDFLAALSQDKRKKIRQERRKVAQAGVTLRWCRGSDISASDWAFFWRCYERTYLEHGNPPYLKPAFFQAMAESLVGHWLMFVAEREGQPIAASLIGLDAADDAAQVAYGRYWGALQRVDCLHFELCYYAPLQWCIEHGVARFEGGAQGEHKMARALLPSPTASAHWLAHPGFAQAVARFLQDEQEHLGAYVQQLEQRTPFRLRAP